MNINLIEFIRETSSLIEISLVKYATEMLLKNYRKLNRSYDFILSEDKNIIYFIQTRK